MVTQSPVDHKSDWVPGATVYSESRSEERSNMQRDLGCGLRERAIPQGTDAQLCRETIFRH